MRLGEQLMLEYPDVFQGGGDYPGVLDGWIREILFPLCAKLRELGIGPEFHVDQIKEKFGGLRFYASCETDEQYEAICAAERESYTVCELCGSRENVSSKGGWVKTFCEPCHAACLKETP